MGPGCGSGIFHASFFNCHSVISEEMKLNIQCWLLYMRAFNGMDFIIDPGFIKFSFKGDVCMEYWSRTLPDWMMSNPIHQKEYWFLLVSIKLWGPTWSGQAVELFVDNTAVCLWETGN